MSLQAFITPLDKGQITIPVRFREKLNIDKNTVLRVRLQQGGLLIEPMRMDWKEKYIREYTDEEIKEFIKTDRLDKKTLKKIQKYLK